MITPTIKPLNQISGYESRWAWDKEEKATESRFAKRMRRASDEHENDRESLSYRFDNPAFNILSGKTNYAVSEIASELAAENVPVIAYLTKT